MSAGTPVPRGGFCGFLTGVLQASRARLSSLNLPETQLPLVDTPVFTFEVLTAAPCWWSPKSRSSSSSRGLPGGIPEHKERSPGHSRPAPPRLLQQPGSTGRLPGLFVPPGLEGGGANKASPPPPPGLGSTREPAANPGCGGGGQRARPGPAGCGHRAPECAQRRRRRSEDTPELPPGSPGSPLPARIPPPAAPRSPAEPPGPYLAAVNAGQGRAGPPLLLLLLLLLLPPPR